jgi:hypothetical protein
VPDRRQIVHGGPNGVLGDFEMSRINNIMRIMTPIMAAQRQQPKEGLKAEDVATNEFIDQSVKLGN